MEKKEELTVKQKIAMFSANKTVVGPNQVKEFKSSIAPLAVDTHAKHSYVMPNPMPVARENKYVPPARSSLSPLPPLSPLAPFEAAPEVALDRSESSESESKCAVIGDGVMLWTENVKGTCTTYKYSIESSIFKKILFTFNFEGSENFQVSPAGEKRLEAQVVVQPFERSQTVTCQQADPSKGGSLKMSMSWSVSAPDPDIVARHVTAHEKELEQEAETSKILDGLTTYDQIRRACHDNHLMFYDFSFPPVFDSLARGDKEGDTSARRTFVWRRPSQYFADTPVEIVTAVRPKDVKQGYLSDFYFSTALAIIAEHPVLVTTLFEGLNAPDATERGVYRVKLCITGMWVTVIVDDFFPCMPRGSPVYSRASGNKLWVLLLEKAYAKIHGSFKAIKVGWSIDAFTNLTGAPQQDYRISELQTRHEEERNTFWEYLRTCCNNKYLVSASACNQLKAVKDKELAKLRPGHSYCIISMHTTSSGERLAQFRNPWSALEWKGHWSASSLLWTDALKEEVGWKDEDKEDTFWMCFQDFFDHFLSINVCYCRDASINENGWHEFREPIQFTFFTEKRGLESVPMFDLEVPCHAEDSSYSVEVFISVHQVDKRVLGAHRYADFGVCILRVTEDGGFEHVQSTGNSITRQNQLAVPKLTVGKYIIIPTTASCKMEQRNKKLKEAGIQMSDGHLSLEAAIVVHASEPVHVKKRKYDAAIFDLAAELAIASEGLITDLFGDSSVTLYTRKSPGNMGICYAARNNRETGAVCFTLDVSDSDNIISDKGILLVECPIPAGRTKLILHVAPADDEYSWTCGLFCKARTISDLEMAQLLSNTNPT